MNSSLENKIVTFDSSKQFKYIKNLGRGGTGDTNLFLDESVDMLFAIKKYSPSIENDVEECYKRFIDEIKILFTIFHKNVVRIYNYYLYPSFKTGYIQMEYIDGETIDKVNPLDYGKTWNEYFLDTINAFDYLYDNQILHRDIRVSNFMVTEDGTLKIIDFGFGKHFSDNNKQNSICLNWPATIQPEEVVINKEYTYSTEIYYIGELFKHLVKNDSTFLYKNILDKMLEYSPSKRYASYKEIKQDISGDLFSQIDFTDNEKSIYIAFADGLYDSILKFTSSPEFKYDIEEIRILLEKIVKISSLEYYVQRNDDVISCFVSTSFRYTRKCIIESETLINFYRLFVNSNNFKKSIIVDSIIARLKNVPVEIELDPFADLPF
ncbi:TPA: protein kinase family protein [Candidatus Ventrenecus avicola]|nr:protein kinase family protein [Candidatus Ventrenecus avicola]